MSKKIQGIIRHILTAGAGWLIGKGYVDESTAMEIVGGILGIVGVAWSYFAPEKKD